ncbi:MAG TPA: calcium-binding protein [Rhizomicrobium sp.]|nr:calcium-binding protein [Rhizomicrobium sp.]
MTTYIGTSGNDTITGSSSDDFFNMNDGGNDTVNGGAGNDIFTFAGTLTSADKINGGTGSDSVILSGDYTAGVTFSSTTMTNVEELDLFGATNNYKLTLNNATIASGQTLLVNATGLDASHTLYLDATADTDAFLTVNSGAGNDTLKLRAGGQKITSGGGNDTITLTSSLGGAWDKIDAGAGNDTISIGAMLNNSGEAVNGGIGTDTLTIAGDYSIQLSLNATSITGIETLKLTAGNSYYLREHDGNVAAGQTLFVDGSALAVGQTLTWLGFNETDGKYRLDGGAGDDTLTGSTGNDIFNGNGGNDVINTGAGDDVVNGGDGNDTVNVGAFLHAAQKFDGGTGANTLALYGDTTAVLNATTMKNFNSLTMGGAFNYNITLNDANVAAGSSLTLSDTAADTAGHTLKIDASAETDGNITVSISGAEQFDVTTGKGFDHVNVLGTFLASDKINGGTAADFINLNGGTAGHIVATAATFQNIGQISFDGNFSSDIAFDDGNVGAGKTLYVYDGINMTAANTLKLDGSAETDGSFNFHLDGAEKKIVTGGAIYDAFYLDGSLKATDSLDGGGGTTDSLILNGDYSSGLTLGANTIKNIELIQLIGGHSYTITTNDGNVAAGAQLQIEEGGNLATDVVIFDGSAETDGSFKFTSGLSSDTLTGGAGADYFGTGMGNDTLEGLGGDDQFNFGPGEFTSADKLDGGQGIDTLSLSGQFAPLTFGAATIQNIETINLFNGSFALVTNDANVAAGQTLTVAGGSLSGFSLTFNGSAETDGSFKIVSALGNDDLTGGAQADTFITGVGSDDVHGGGGDDIIYGSGLDATDTFDGGAGNDTLYFFTTYNGTFGASSLTSIERIKIESGSNYSFTTNDGNVAAGATLTLDASNLSANTLTFDGSAELDGKFVLTGGLSGDTLKGGAGDDIIQGGDGNNTLNGNGGNDTLSVAGSWTNTLDGGSGIDTINGGTGTNFIFGGDGDDVIVSKGNDFIQSGNDNDAINISGALISTVDGGAGDDTITAGNALTSADVIDGGAGNDTLALSGDYSNLLSFSPVGLANVETISLKSNSTYNLKIADANVAAGQTLTVSINGTSGTTTVKFDGSAESDGFLSLQGGNGDDVLIGGGTDDSFSLGRGGNDTANGGAGNDTFTFVAAFTAADTVDGGTGTDTLSLAGDYSAGLVFAASTMVNVETITLKSGTSYNLTTDNATVAAGQTLTVTGSALGSGNTLIFNGAAEKDGMFSLSGGAGDDVLTGGAKNDNFDLTKGGNDTAVGGAGGDDFLMGGALTASDALDGASGNDAISLSGDYSAGLVFNATTIARIEEIDLAKGNGYKLTTNDANVASGATLTVDGHLVEATFAIVIDGSAETDGKFVMISGAGADTLIGGAGNDTLTGGKGADTLTGNGGADTFVYTGVLDSTTKTFDTIVGFDANADRFDLDVSVTGVDATVGSGALSSATFDADLAAVIGAGQLGSGHAVLFTATSGGLSGHTMLIVDANGTAGYQASADYVFDVTGLAHAGSLNTADFI